ncbi:MAG: acyl-CoA thioester hydrolase [Deferribacteres bacterium]|nr:acyl-CoA thioester hydrolase [Deferribacteres bacterium]
MFSKEIKLRFSDMDMYGHLNHAKYFTLMEAARTEIFLEDFLKLKENNIFLLITNVECSYKRPVSLEDKLIIDMNFYQISKTRFEGSYVLHNGEGVVYAEAKTTLACFDAAKGKSCEVPDILKEKFENMRVNND